MIKKNTLTKSIHGYSREGATAIQSSENISAYSIQEAQSNHNISNIAIELLPNSAAFKQNSDLHTMASYNDSNRVPDHATRWNTK
jgi:hypothetical protein